MTAPARSDVAVVPATRERAAGIRALAGLSASTLRRLDRDLTASDQCHLVGLSQGVVVGYAAGVLLADEGHIVDLAVAEERRREGIGTALVSALTDGLRELGATGVTLEVRRTNAAAQALYRHLGFAVEGERARYYPDGESALLMWQRGDGKA